MGKKDESISGTVSKLWRNDVIKLLSLIVVAVMVMGVSTPFVGDAVGGYFCEQGWISGDKCIAPDAAPAKITPEEEEKEELAGLAICHETPSTAVRVRTKNILNTTTADYTPTQTIYIYGEADGYIGSVTAVATSTFTATSPSSIDCGHVYIMKPVASSTSSTTILESDKGEVLPNGNLRFTATGATVDITLKIEKKSESLQFRAFDTANTGIYNSAAASSASWVTTPTFKCTTDNSTATAVGANENWEGYLWFKSASAYTNVVDSDAKILLDAGASGATYWDTPKLLLDGVELTECSDTLSSDENKAYADYEWVYCYSGAVTNTHRSLYYQLKSIADPANDVKFSFVSAGNYLSVDGETVEKACVQDDTSKTTVYTKLDVTFDLA